MSLQSRALYAPYKRPESGRKSFVTKIKDFFATGKLFGANHSDEESASIGLSDEEHEERETPRENENSGTRHRDQLNNTYSRLARRSRPHRKMDSEYSGHFHTDNPSQWSERKTFTFPAPDVQKHDILGANFAHDEAPNYGASDILSVHSGGMSRDSSGPQEKIMDFLRNKGNDEISEVEMRGLVSLVDEWKSQNSFAMNSVADWNESFQHAAAAHVSQDLEHDNEPHVQRIGYQSSIPSLRSVVTSSRRSSHSFAHAGDRPSWGQLKTAATASPFNSQSSRPVQRHGISSPYHSFAKRRAESDSLSTSRQVKRIATSAETTSKGNDDRDSSSLSPKRPLSLTANAVLSILEPESATSPPQETNKRATAAVTSTSNFGSGTNPYIKPSSSITKSAKAPTSNPLPSQINKTSPQLSKPPVQHEPLFPASKPFKSVSSTEPISSGKAGTETNAVDKYKPTVSSNLRKATVAGSDDKTKPAPLFGIDKTNRQKEEGTSTISNMFKFDIMEIDDGDATSNIDENKVDESKKLFTFDLI